MVEFLKGIDQATGGDGVTKGLVSPNPDVTHHFMRGFMGGLYTNTIQGISFGFETYKAIKGEEHDSKDIVKLKHIKAKDTPLKAFYTSKDDLRLIPDDINRKYYDLTKEVSKASYKAKGYTKKARDGEISFPEQVEMMKKLNIVSIHWGA